MWRNYLKTAYRNLIRNRVYATMNILGLTVGIACFSLIMLYVENELSYDTFHHEEAYRLLIREEMGDGDFRKFGIVSLSAHDEIAANVAGVEDHILLRDWGAGPLVVDYKDVSFKSRKVMFAEAEFFDYFGFKMLQGNAETALADPGSVVITRSTAEKIFGNANPMGEVISFEGTVAFDLKVAGVMEDTDNSYMDFEFLVAFDTKNAKNGSVIMREGWRNSIYGYYKLAEGVQPEAVAKRTKEFYLDKYKDDASTLSYLENESYAFQPVSEIYFNSADVTFDDSYRKGSKMNVMILSAIGLFILLIACMNYINAATAKAMIRAKEVGVRKVFGAYRSQLLTQFLGEAFVVTFLSVLISVLLADISLPYFEQLLDTKITDGLLLNPVYLPGLLAILVVVTLLSGIYPAVVLSGMRVSQTLKDNSKSILKGNGLRSLLVGIQLTLSIMLISGLFLILKQTNYINTKSLGFQKEDILIIPNNSDEVARELTAFKTELERSPFVKQTTVGMDVLGFGTTNNSGYVGMAGGDESNTALTTFFTVGMNFIDLHEMQLVEGRTFNPELTSDSTSIIVNEAFVRTLGLEDPIGKKVQVYRSAPVRPIIGVVKDFNFQSLHNAINPVIFTVNRSANWYFTVKVDPQHVQEAVAHARATWESIEPNYPFGYMFLDDNLDAFYEKDKQLQRAIQNFAIICIFISCLGIYGMTLFTIERKTKEIGIRKVLGADVKNLLWLINNRFFKLMGLAALVAIPIVYLGISKWLENFAFHIEIGVMSFVWAALIVVAIVASTVSFQALKAATSNPSKTLKTE